MLPYYCALGVMWVGLWVITALVLGPLPNDLREYHFRRWHPRSIAGLTMRLTECPRIVLASGIFVWMVFYVLSYAPTVQAIEAGRLALPRSMMDFYVPVQWLTDETPLREPLLRWADIYGQRRTFVVASAARYFSGYWGTTPAWLYATGWLVAGLAFVVGPAWLVRLILIRLLRACLPMAARA